MSKRKRSKDKWLKMERRRFLIILLALLVFSILLLTPLNPKKCKQDSDCVKHDQGCCSGCGYDRIINRGTQLKLNLVKEVACLVSGPCPQVYCEDAPYANIEPVCRDQRCQAKKVLVWNDICRQVKEIEQDTSNQSQMINKLRREAPGEVTPEQALRKCNLRIQ